MSIRSPRLAFGVAVATSIFATAGSSLAASAGQPAMLPKVDFVPALPFNQFQIGSTRPIEIAVLSTRTATDPGHPNLDAARVSPSSLRFGPRQVAPASTRLVDIDHDGDRDLVATFNPALAGLDATSTKAKLRGTATGLGTFSVTSKLIPVRTDPLDPLLPSYTVFTNPSDSLFLEAVRPDGHTVRYSGVRGASGLPARIEVVEIVRPDGTRDVLQYDTAGRPKRAVIAGSMTFNFEWVTTTRLLITFVDPAGLEIRSFFDLTPGLRAGALAVATPLAPSIRGGVETQFWFDPGLPPAAADLRSMALAAAPQSAASVRITRCGDRPVDDAQLVNFRMTSPSQPGQVIERWATLAGDGRYTAPLPVADASIIGSVVGDTCDALSTALGVACLLGGDIAEYGDVICPQLRQLAMQIPHPGAAAAARAIALACPPLMNALEISCKTLGYSPDPAAPSVSDVLCAGLRKAIDAALAGDEVTIQAHALIPSPSSGLIAYSSAPTAAPATGPFPALSIDAGGQLSIASYTTSPFDPAPGQGYTARAEIACVPAAGVSVTMSIVGTDGYSNSRTTTITTDGATTLFVPGAAPGVVDTITISVGGLVSRTITIVF